MTGAFLKHLSDPLTAKLILEIQERGTMTTAQLLEKCKDIPQATLYRRMQKLLKDGVLKVARENPIRGTVEKVYALAFDIKEAEQKLAKSNDGAAYVQLVTYYLMGILQEFNHYAAKENIDLAGDGSGCSIAPVYATHEELTAALMRIGGAIEELQSQKPDGKRKLRNLCIITTPPQS